MKKTILIASLVLCAVFVLGFVLGCGGDEEEDVVHETIADVRDAALGADGWDRDHLSPSVDLAAPEGIEMVLDSWGSDTVTATFTNNSGTEWFFGEYFVLQVLLGDVWYDIPPEDDVAFLDVAYTLQPGDVQEQEYNIAPFGDLPAGTYRITAYGLYVEHTLP